MKPGLAKGTRDFSAQEIYKRRHITNCIQQNFELFGFQPLETPSFENLSTLMGKYGEEGDRLIFKILNSGNYLADISDEEMGLNNPTFLTPKISDKALRYDLTVPFARFVAMNRGTLFFPFKRYQIQPVWRADRPQKGRYREFYQCDADVVGSESLLQEVELLQLYLKTFADLKIDIEVLFNNRKILTGLAEIAGIPDKIIDFTVALDKIDKVGRDKVVEELLTKNIPQQSIDILSFLFESYSDNNKVLAVLDEKFASCEIGKAGVNEVRFVLEKLKIFGRDKAVKIDLTLARGLNYYTGAIFEVKAKDVSMGSIGGGGRYNNLTEVFGVKDMPGIGISFGLDRIYLVMEELGLFPENTASTLGYLFANYGETESVEALKLIAKLHGKNVSAELFPEAGKMNKFFSYADKRNAENLVFIGELEIAENKISIKNQISGEKKTISQEEFFGSL